MWTAADGDKRGGLAMQCDKNEYRGILAGLEGVSGKKAITARGFEKFASTCAPSALFFTPTVAYGNPMSWSLVISPPILI